MDRFYTQLLVLLVLPAQHKQKPWNSDREVSYLNLWQSFEVHFHFSDMFDAEITFFFRFIRWTMSKMGESGTTALTVREISTSNAFYFQTLGSSWNSGLNAKGTSEGNSGLGCFYQVSVPWHASNKSHPWNDASLRFDAMSLPSRRATPPLRQMNHLEAASRHHENAVVDLGCGSRAVEIRKRLEYGGDRCNSDKNIQYQRILHEDPNLSSCSCQWSRSPGGLQL
jgi:hypothetical protein